uniref:Reverse transcriptase domain-containing protein n=1 Tax=Photinus pyralis TaxID=7054 RepID=A0A1Y1NKD6_PHOPY
MQKSSTLIDYIVISSDIKVSRWGTLSMHNYSDHHLVYCTLLINDSKIDKPFYYTYRNFRNFNLTEFDNDLKFIDWECAYTLPNINDKVDFLNDNILALFDKHAECRRIKITKPPAPWLTDNIKLMISLRNKALTKFKRTKNPAHWSYYKQLRNFTTNAIRLGKKAYLEYELQQGHDTPKAMWKKLKQLGISSSHKRELPNELRDANKINDFFINLAETVTSDENALIQYYTSNAFRTSSTQFNFSLVTEVDVLKTFLNLKSNSVGWDGISLCMWKLCLPYLAPIITHIVNSCLVDGIFPNCWKVAKVIPLAKINDPREFKDIRPISILPCLSKVVEKIMASQIRTYLDYENILPRMQSGFRPGYSCNTALAYITDAIMRAIDNNNLAVLVLLDYSKAFDRISHNILIAILKHIGFSGSASSLINNYISGRSQYVMLDGDASDTRPVVLGVPQGSILGPLLYIIYTLDMVSVLQHCGYHLYADDTQLFYEFPAHALEKACTNVNADLENLIVVSERHGLKINSHKSFVMLFGRTKARNVNAPQLNVKIGESLLPNVDSVKNLGLTIDSTLRFKKHVSELLRIAYLKLKTIFNNRHVLNRKLKIMLCESLVLSQFTYCDNVYGPCLDAFDVGRVQRVQNSCLRLIFGLRKYNRISHKLVEIKWLNMSNRRKLNHACFIHKIISNKFPPYLYEKIQFRHNLHNLNTRTKHLISIPKHQTVLYQRSFSYNVPKIYNSLSCHLHSCSQKRFRENLRLKLLEQQQTHLR